MILKQQARLLLGAVCLMPALLASTGCETPSKGRSAARRAAVPLVDLTDAQLLQRIETAGLVFVGRVVAIRSMVSAVAADDRPAYISEHNPMWQEAVIEVQSALRGTQKGQQVVVRFPGSRDVAFWGAPRFEKHQEGTFFLRPDVATGLPKSLLAGIEVPTFTALDAKDVLSIDFAERVRMLLDR